MDEESTKNPFLVERESSEVLSIETQIEVTKKTSFYRIGRNFFESAVFQPILVFIGKNVQQGCGEGKGRIESSFNGKLPSTGTLIRN